VVAGIGSNETLNISVGKSQFPTIGGGWRTFFQSNPEFFNCDGSGV